MSRPQNRALLTAVLLSLAVHAFVLFVHLPSVRRALEAAVPPPLVARIEPEVEKPMPEKIEPEKKPEPPRLVTPPKPREPQAEPVPEKVESTKPREPPPAAPQAAPPAAASAPAPATASASARARTMSSEAATAQTVAQYRLQVLGAAAAFNRYPRLARENNWEGAVEVAMRVRGDGAGADLSVRKGSGHEVLDEQALEMFRKAQERVPLPGSLRGRDFTIELKAVYRLKDAEASQ